MVKILVVDDYEITHLVLKMLFKNKHCALDHVITGVEALDYIVKNKYDLILMDIGLPDINGLDLCEKIKQINADLPIVVLSAYSNEEYKKKARFLGIKEYIEKPFTSVHMQMIMQLVPDLA